MKQKSKSLGPMVGLSISKYIALLDVSELREFHLQIESKFKRDIAKISEKFENQIKELNISQKKELTDFLGGENLAIKTYMLIHRKSTIVSLCSLIEARLDGICRSLYKKKNVPQKHTDIKKDKGIKRARKYIKTYTEIDFSKLNSKWENLQNLFKIRNCITHCNGDIKLFKKPEDISTLENLVQSSKWLSLKGKRHLELEKEFVDEALDNAFTFTEKLYEEYFQWTKRE